MKKVLAIILCLAALLSLTACGKDKDKDREERPTLPAATEPTIEAPVIESEPENEGPTAEEWEAIEEYGEVLDKLRRFDILNSDDIREEQYLFEDCYQKLLELEAVDKWVGTEWGDSEDLDKDRKDVLAAFVVIEDVLLEEERSSVDGLGNPNGTTTKKWGYDEEGRVSLTDYSHLYIDYAADPWENRSHTEQIVANPTDHGKSLVHYVYNEEGRLEKIDYHQRHILNRVELRRNLVYENDILVREDIVGLTTSDDETVTYQYDDMGRVIEITREGSHGFESNYRDELVYQYAYDEQGRLLSERFMLCSWNWNTEKFEPEKTVLTTYTYDQDGRLAAGMCVNARTYYDREAEIISEWVYTYDADGRIIEVSVNNSDLLYKDTGEVCQKVSDTTAKSVMKYGNFYIYLPAVEE